MSKDHSLPSDSAEIRHAAMETLRGTLGEELRMGLTSDTVATFEETGYLETYRRVAYFMSKDEKHELLLQLKAEKNQPNENQGSDILGITLIDRKNGSGHQYYIYSDIEGQPVDPRMSFTQYRVKLQGDLAQESWEFGGPTTDINVDYLTVREQEQDMFWVADILRHGRSLDINNETEVPPNQRPDYNERDYIRLLPSNDRVALAESMTPFKRNLHALTDAFPRIVAK